MTLRSLISFDHVQQGANYALTPQGTYGPNALQSIYGMPGTIMYGSMTSNTAYIMATSNWLQIGPIANANYLTGWVISFADLNILQNGATKAWIGFRTFASGAGSSTAIVAGLSATPGVQTNTGVTPITAILTEAQLNRVSYGVGGAQYVEILLDMVALTASIYINGIFTLTSTFPAGQLYLTFSGGPLFGVATYQAFRDLYFMDVDSTLPNSRLGPITSAALSPSSVSAPNYLNYIGSLSGGSSISATAYKFGGSSLFPSATTTGLATFTDAPALRTAATADCTYEFWMNPSNVTQTATLFGKDAGAAPYARLNYISNTLAFYADSSAIILTSSNTGMVAGNWYHVALVRYQGTWTIYVNGVSVGAVAGTSTVGNNPQSFCVGNSNSANASFQGYLDEFRVSNMARYTGAFTPPANQFTTDVNTMLLCHFDAQNGTLIADSAFAIPSALNTVFGSPPSMTPFLLNPTTNDPLTTTFAPVVASGQKVVAMQYKLAAQVQMAMNVGAKVTNGTQTTNLPGLQIRDINAAYGRDLGGIVTAAPDGTAWTAASIAASSLVMTPATLT